MIATHSGAYHWDDCLAVYMLKTLPRYADYRVVRTRLPQTIDEADVVLDVGDVYDPARQRFDHHMLGFDVVFDESRYEAVPPYRSSKRVVCSSAGLVYKHFGREILLSLLSSMRSSGAIAESEEIRAKQPENLDWLFKKVYYDYLQAVDAGDNGISLVEASCDLPEASISLKTVATDRSSMASKIARHQSEATITQNAAETNNYLESFLAASKLAGEEFRDFVRFTVKYSLDCWLRGCAAFTERKSFHPSGRVLFIQDGGFDGSMVFELEEYFKVPEAECILYVARESESGYRITTVPVAPASYVSRLPYPKDWWGKRDAALSAASGIPGMTFCHKNGFTGGMQTRQAMMDALNAMMQRLRSPARGPEE